MIKINYHVKADTHYDARIVVEDYIRGHHVAKSIDVFSTFGYCSSHKRSEIVHTLASVGSEFYCVEAILFTPDYLYAKSDSERIYAPGILDVIENADDPITFSYEWQAKNARAWWGAILAAYHAKDGRKGWDQYISEMPD